MVQELISGSMVGNTKDNGRKIKRTVKGFSHGKMGSISMKKCRRYIGAYLDDKKHGYGEFHWPDGRYYRGFWADGKQHGRGVYKGADGQESEGEWLNGQKVR